MSTKNSKIDIISIDSVIFRPKTRSELLNKLKEGVKCEVLESNKETTSIMLDGWLIFRGKYKIYPSENIGWVIYEIVNSGIGTKDRRGIDKETSENLKEMSNEALIGFAEDQITELVITGGRSHKMCVPPSITDTDMLFSELIRRFKKALAN